VMGRHEVKKTKAGTAEMATESGVFENEPTTVVEGVVRSADFPTSDVDQVFSVQKPRTQELCGLGPYH